MNKITNMLNIISKYQIQLDDKALLILNQTFKRLLSKTKTILK